MAKRKIAEKDFLESDLPQTRRAQFFDILKNHFPLLFKLGLILFGALFLLIAKSAAMDYLNFYNFNMMKDGAISQEEGEYVLRIAYIIANGADVILYPGFLVVLGGVLRIIRQLCHSEGILFSYLFKKGIKDNWKQFALLGFLVAFLKFGMNLLIAFFGFNVYTIIIFVFFLLIILPVAVTFLFYAPIYSSTFLISLRNSGYVYLKSILYVLGYVILTFALPILLEFFWSAVFYKQLVYIVASLLLLPIDLLLGYEMYLSRFDSLINIYEFQTSVRQGLYVPNEELERLVAMATEKRGGLDGDGESLQAIKSIVGNFAIKGSYITSLQKAGENAYEVIIDKERHYRLLRNSSKEESKIDDHYVKVLTNEGNPDYLDAGKGIRYTLLGYEQPRRAKR